MTSLSAGYSAAVELRLLVGDREFELAEVGPHEATVREPEDILPINAEIVVRVDGQERRRAVFLVDGLSQASERFRFIAR